MSDHLCKEHTLLAAVSGINERQSEPMNFLFDTNSITHFSVHSPNVD